MTQKNTFAGRDMQAGDAAQATRRWNPRRHMIAGVLGLVLLLGGVGSWSALANISGAIISPGRIEVEQNRQVIQHPDGGVVEAILVSEGDLVQEGDILIQLDAEAILSELAIVESQLFEVIARRARHEAERDAVETLDFDPLIATQIDPDVVVLMAGQSTLHAARRETEQQQKDGLARQNDQIASQIVGIRAQQASVASQLDLIGAELVNQTQLLSRGLTDTTRVLALQRDTAGLQGRAGELAAAVAQAEERMTGITIEMLLIATTRREAAIAALRDLQSVELELSERRRVLHRRLERLDIRAPVSGIVYDMQVFARRSVLRPADSVMFLVPQDRPLVIAVQVEPRDIDQIFLGQDVNLRFSAFDQKRTPELTGQVMHISADSFQNEQRGTSFFRAEIALHEGQLAGLPDSMKLIPGMPVEAFIRTGDRTPIAYLVKPLSDYFAKAFREG